MQMIRSRRGSRKSVKIIGAVAAAAMSLLPSGARADFVWDNTTGNWTDGSHWGGTAPTSSATNVLVFGPGAADYTATNDNATTPFQLNKIQITGPAASVNTLTATTLTNTLDFVANGTTQP